MTDFIAAYRVQLSAQFRFEDVLDKLDYIAGLGISHLYLSPIIESEPGSTHGYDGVDPRKISAERGGERGFRRLCEELQARYPKMGIILDIVPNHLGVSWNNPYWRDVLENGRASKHSCLFDISWTKGSGGRLTLPVLGSPLKECLKKGELKADVLSGWGIVIKYYDNLFPCEPKTYVRLINGFLRTDGLPSRSEGALEALVNRIDHLPPWREAKEDRTDDVGIVRDGFLKICAQHNLTSSVTDYLNQLSQQDLSAILDEQVYQLEYWRDGLKKLNYRRFFDISELAGLRTADPAVFNFIHEKLFELARAYPCIQGFRIDHIDGLKDPGMYLNKLHGFEKNSWIEKILGDEENIPSDWPVCGTVGYEYLNAVDELFIRRGALASLNETFWQLVPEQSFAEALIKAKNEVLANLFQAELNSLCENLSKILSGSYESSLKRKAIITITSYLPVYRTYFSAAAPRVREEDKTLFLETIEKCRRNTSSEDQISIFEELSRLIKASQVSERVLQWLEQWQQLSGPAMAKGLEDTTLYRIFPLSCLNEVGTHCSTRINNDLEHYIRFIACRQKRFPYPINTSSTHDTKRSEDTRYRIAAISEWKDEFVALFNLSVQKFENELPEEVEWLVLQSLIGIWPFDAANKTVPISSIRSRLQSYLEKALRESKRYSDWLEPDSELEEQTKLFIHELLADEDFSRQMAPLLHDIGRAGAVNSLCATTLKLISPGFVDLYQGSEQWHQYLVDPDNRQPVDYAKLRDGLERARTAEPVVFLDKWQSGLIKQSIVYRLIRLRQTAPDLFAQGTLQQLPVHGEKAEHLMAVCLSFEERFVVAFLPRFLKNAFVPDSSSLNLSPSFWQDTYVDSRGLSVSSHWNCIMTGQTLAQKERVKARDILDETPVAVWSNVSH